MRQSRSESWGVSAAGLMGAVALGAIAFELGPLRFGWTPTIASGVLLIVLLAMDRRAARSFAESVAYGASCGFLLATAAIFPLFYFLPEMAISPADAFSAKLWLPAICLLGTLIFLVIDRARNNTGPVVLTMREEAPSPKRNEITRPEIPSSQAEAFPLAASSPQTPPAGVAVSGKPTVIFMNLVNTGVVCLRPVQAEHLKRDFYKIVEPVPEGEEWEFQPGQVVRCRKQSLSSGKSLVAFEEAPRVV